MCVQGLVLCPRDGDIQGDTEVDGAQRRTGARRPGATEWRASAADASVGLPSPSRGEEAGLVQAREHLGCH